MTTLTGVPFNQTAQPHKQQQQQQQAVMTKNLDDPKRSSFKLWDVGLTDTTDTQPSISLFNCYEVGRNGPRKAARRQAESRVQSFQLGDAPFDLKISGILELQPIQKNLQGKFERSIPTAQARSAPNSGDSVRVQRRREYEQILWEVR